jgi:hypothetical protein
MVPGVTAADLHRVAHAVVKGRVSRETRDEHGRKADSFARRGG